MKGERQAALLTMRGPSTPATPHHSHLTARWFGAGVQKVGMCGDGANDLMAIRQADVGIGISDSDASYAACFTISKMLDV